MKIEKSSPEYTEKEVADASIFDGDLFENQARVNRGELPIVFRGTRTDRLESSVDCYSGTYKGKTYFGYNLDQAKSFAKVNGGNNNGAIIRVDLQELAPLKGINIKLRENDILVTGDIPKELIDIVSLATAQ